MSYSLDSFFRRFSLASYTDSPKEIKSLSGDSSGIVPSVNDKNAPFITKYIQNLGYDCVLDIGAGLGYLQRAADEIELDCYSFDVSYDLVPHIVCDRSKYCIFDIAQGVDSRLSNSADITTSFEVIEHIHPAEMDSYWNSLERIAQVHLCSIHVDGPKSDLHKTIWSPAKWFDYFNKRGYRYQLLHCFPPDEDLSLQKKWNLCAWGSSMILLIEL
jgi:hypothetical protein